jgi:hypothetical protein
VISRLRKVVCKSEDDVLELPEELPELLADEADKGLGCCTAAGIVGDNP